MENLNARLNALPWSSIPTELLRAELSRRDDVDSRPPCGSGKRGSYNTGAHVFALFLILALSTAACGFPLVSRRLSNGSSRQKMVIFLCQHFGTGVLMATAFVHLLPTAFSSLTDPCLPSFFNKGYRPLAGLIAMVSALIVVAVESYLTTRGASHSHSHTLWDGEDEDEDGTHTHSPVGEAANRREHSHGSGDIALHDIESTEGLVAGASPLPGSTPTIPPNGKMTLRDQRNSVDDDEGDSIDLNFPIEELSLAPNGGNRDSAVKPGPGLPSLPHSSEEQKRLLIQCLLLEAGILFHSVFIGMAISVATGPTFVVFLIAISFHQSFEGLALGTRIAAIHFPKQSARPWLMVLAFGATTPIGQAIGLFIHRFYDPMSQTGLLMVGFMNAISSGLLLFAGLVQLLAEDFLSEKSYKSLRGKKRAQAYLAVVGGAALMSTVGAFA